MKARINLAKFPEGRPGYYAMIEDEKQYERVRDVLINYEKSKRVTHYLVPASVFERLLALDKCREKLCGGWILVKDDDGKVKPHCSCCGAEAHKDEAEYIYSPFCHQCGADLREDFDKEEEESNE